MKRSPLHRQQQGVVLIMALVILVLVTLVGLSTIRTTTMEEKMAGNSRDRDKALQAAEAAVRACLGLLNTNPANYTATKHTPAAWNANPVWEVETNWSTTGAPANAFEVSMILATAGLTEKPRCIVETMGASGSYRVTGRAKGGSDQTVVMLQAIYTKE